MSHKDSPETRQESQGASASREKIAALQTAEYLRERGQSANASDLAAVLALVPDVEPEEYDRFPSAPAP